MDKEKDLREELENWEAMEPPAGFAERVIAARGSAVESSPKNRKKRVLVTVSALVAMGLFATVLTRSARRVPAREGTVLASLRESVELGHRGVAVAESGAAIDWRVEGDGTATIEHKDGDVFYRVNPGGTFAVHTPAGRVLVEGTCFRVEVSEMNAVNKGFIGAAVGVLVTVTVYEGKVLFATDAGESEIRTLEAGESMTASSAGKPVAGADSEQVVVMPEPPRADISRDELLERDSVQRAEIASLREKVRGLEAAKAKGNRAKLGEDDEDGQPWFDPSKEKLAQFAKDCRVRYDVPPVLGDQPMQISPEMAAELEMPEQERGAINAAFSEIHTGFVHEVRQLYIEATGDAEGVESLSPRAMESEIKAKSSRGEMARIQRLISSERAGLSRPPESLEGTTALERYMRLLASMGDDMEANLAAKIGPERARELRSKNGGWGMRMEVAGCPDDDEQSEGMEEVE